jgi:hypothetical protein
MGATEFPARFVPNFKMDVSMMPLGAPTGPLRAPGSNALAFVHQSFIDELAHAGGQDPLAFQIKLLGDKPLVGDPPAQYNAARMVGVLKAVGEMSNWNTARPSPAEGRGHGRRLLLQPPGLLRRGVPRGGGAAGDVKVKKMLGGRRRGPPDRQSRRRPESRSRAGAWTGSATPCTSRSPSPTDAVHRPTSPTIRCCASTRRRRWK